jgi:hypothetical protein
MSEILTNQQLIEQKGAAETLAVATCIRMQYKPQFTDPARRFLDEWLAEGEELVRRKNELVVGNCQLQFDVGDWLIKCENYKAGEEITGYSKSTLRTFVYVARHVSFYIRNANLAWGIHQLLAPLTSDEDKIRFLQGAVIGKWSVSAARAVLQKEQASGRFKSSVEPKSASDYATQNIADKNVEAGDDKDEMETFVSKERLQRAIGRMLQWKFCPIDDEQLSRAVRLLSSNDKAKVINNLRKAAQKLLNMADRMEAVVSVVALRK